MLTQFCNIIHNKQCFACGNVQRHIEKAFYTLQIQFIFRIVAQNIILKHPSFEQGNSNMIKKFYKTKLILM